MAPHPYEVESSKHIFPSSSLHIRQPALLGEIDVNEADVDVDQFY